MEIHGRKNGPPLLPLLYYAAAGSPLPSMIQGSVSLNTETKDSALILQGIHKHLTAGWQRVEDKGWVSSGFEHCVTTAMLTNLDAINFISKRTSVTCKRGVIRITLQQLPKGSSSLTIKTVVLCCRDRLRAFRLDCLGSEFLWVQSQIFSKSIPYSP